MNGTSMAFEARELEIPADFEKLHDAREWARQLADEFGLGEHDCFHVELAMSEAVTNAIVHGSHGDGDVVELTASAEGDLLVFEVSDRGHHKPAGDHGDRLAEGGRGLELVAKVMDEAELVRRGSGGLLRFGKSRAAYT